MQDRNTTTTPPNYPHPPVQQLKLDPIFCHIVSIVHTPKGSEHKRIRAYKKKRKLHCDEARGDALHANTST